MCVMISSTPQSLVHQPRHRVRVCDDKFHTTEPGPSAASPCPVPTREHLADVVRPRDAVLSHEAVHSIDVGPVPAQEDRDPRFSYAYDQHARYPAEVRPQSNVYRRDAM